MLRPPRRWMSRRRWADLISGRSCPICDDLDNVETEHGFLVARLGVSVLNLSRNQFARGYCILVYRRHAAELHEPPSRGKRRVHARPRACGHSYLTRIQALEDELPDTGKRSAPPTLSHRAEILRRPGARPSAGAVGTNAPPSARAVRAHHQRSDGGAVARPKVGMIVLPRVTAVTVPAAMPEQTRSEMDTLFSLDWQALAQGSLIATGTPLVLAGLRRERRRLAPRPDVADCPLARHRRRGDARVLDHALRADPRARLTD